MRRPPRLAEGILTRFLPAKERAEVLGDMAEAHARRVERVGRLRAAAWYWRQSVSIPTRIWWTSLRFSFESQALRHAVRSLRRSPGFTVVAVMTLAVGIGANTAIFSIVNGVMLRPLPYPEPDRLVHIWEHNDTFGRLGSAWTNFLDWSDKNRSFEAIASYGAGTTTVVGGDEPLRARSAWVSEAFFRVIGVQPAIGRPLAADEHALGADPAALISHSFWQTQLGGVEEMAEVRLVVGGYPVRIVGVMPDGFDFPAGTDVWYPLELVEQPTSRTAHNNRVLGRLLPDVDAAQAQEDVSLITSRFALADEPSEYMPQRARVIALREEIAGPVRSPLMLLLGASLMVVLVGCTNLASTLLARGSARADELAVLRALGAGRGRIVRRLFTESLLLAALGAGVGLLLAEVLIRALPAVVPSDLPRMSEVAVDPTVAAFTVLVSVLSALLFGLFPALRVSEADIASALRRGARGSSAARSRGPWRLLVIGEVALALLLLAGAGLLMRSLWTVLQVDGGFETVGVMTMSVSLPIDEYGEAVERAAYFDALLQRVRALPDVDAAGMAATAPLTGYVSNGRIAIDRGPEEHVTAAYQVADAGYFNALRIPLLRGRSFASDDNADTGHVVLINQALADLAWPGEDPIGKRLTGGGMDSYWDQPDAWATVVGIVGSVRQRDLTRDSYPTLYFSYRQRADRARGAAIVARSDRSSPDALVGSLRQAARELDRNVPVEFAAMEQIVADSVGDRRFTAGVLGVFATMALLLAGLGIYGVVGYTVVLRTREMGIRMALGSPPSGVLRTVLRESLTTVSIGLALGLVAALALGRVLSSMLYEVSPTDPLALGVTALILLAVAALASLIPARRAAAIDPLITMQAD